MNLIDRDELIAFSPDSNLQQVLQQLRIEEFCESYRRRSNQQSDFCVAVAERIGEKVVPRGVSIHSINESSITGDLFYNEMPRRTSSTIQVSFKKVLDVRFIDCGVLRMGDTYKYILGTLTLMQRRRFEEHRPFIIAKDDAVFDAIDLLRNKQASKADFDLWRGRRFCAAIPGYIIPGHGTWYASFDSTIQELNALYGTSASTVKLAEASLISPHEDGEELLFLCTSTGNCEVAEKLIELGVRCDTIDIESGMTPLIAAINANQLELASLLLRHGANPNAESYDQRNALFFCNSIDAVVLLATNGANLQHEDVNRFTPLDKFSEAGDSDICNVLISLGARSNQKVIHRDIEGYPKIESSCGEVLPLESF